MTQAAPKPGRFGDLGVRVVSGVALAALALLCVWLGGVWFAGLAALAAGLMLWELHRIVTGADSGAACAILVAAGALAVVAAFVWGVAPAACVLAAGLVGVVLTAPPAARVWLAAGLVYIGGAMCFAPVLRETLGLGFAAVVWLALVVATADIKAYFVGRAVGGPKLWPAVSPGKTWSGALGGLAAAFVVGTIVAAVLGWPILRVGALSAVIAVASQAGDLLESALKRRFGVKDASRLIPGHGGVMDRLDGILGAVWVFGLYVLAGGGLEG